MSKDKNIYRKKNLVYLGFMIPGLIILIMFWVVPMFGTILAFKDYSHMDGIFGSDWVGFKHFLTFIKADNFWSVILTTSLYHTGEVLVVNLAGGAIFALILYEVRSKFANKLYQTSMLLPYFLSMTVIAYIVYLILNPTDLGLLNSIRELLGMERINVYSNAAAWPFILVGVFLWKSVGMASLYLYAALLAVDTELYEAAALDGANKFRQIWHISIPAMLPMMCMTMITQLGAIMTSNFDLHYSVTMNAPALQDNAVNVLSVYIYKGITDGSFGQTAAIGVFTAFVTLVLTIITNAVIKKISPENAMV